MCDINKKPTLGLILISLIITFIENWNGRVMCAIKKTTFCLILILLIRALDGILNG